MSYQKLDFEVRMENLPTGKARFWSLNNFYMYFPQGRRLGAGGVVVEPAKTSTYIKISRKAGMWDEKGTGKSDVRRNQTTKEFFRELYRSVREAGLTMREVSKIRVEKGAPGGHTEANFKRWYETLYPIYIKMREKGYAPTDMTG